MPALYKFLKCDQSSKRVVLDITQWSFALLAGVTLIVDHEMAAAVSFWKYAHE